MDRRNRGGRFYRGKTCYGTGYQMMDEIDRLRAALKSIYNENMRCAGDADSMAMCIVSTQGVARDTLHSTEKEDVCDETE